MRHRLKIKKLGRTKAHRDSMLANLSSSLITNEYIVTTVQKAKACKALTDKVISVGKKKNLNARRRVEQLLRDRLAASKVIDVLADKYVDRVGGFVTIVRLGKRKGDNSEMAKLILIGSEPFRKAKKVKVKKKKTVKGDDKEKSVKEETKPSGGVLKGLRGRFQRSQGVGKESKRAKEISKSVETKSRSGI